MRFSGHGPLNSDPKSQVPIFPRSRCQMSSGSIFGICNLKIESIQFRVQMIDMGWNMHRCTIVIARDSQDLSRICCAHQILRKCIVAESLSANSTKCSIVDQLLLLSCYALVTALPPVPLPVVGSRDKSLGLLHVQNFGVVWRLDS